MPVFPLGTLRDQPSKSGVDDAHHNRQEDFRDVDDVCASGQNDDHKAESDEHSRKDIEKNKLKDFDPIRSSHIDPHDVSRFLSPTDSEVELVLKVTFHFVFLPGLRKQVTASFLRLYFIDELFRSFDVLESY